MSKIVVDLETPTSGEAPLSSYEPDEKPRRFRKVLGIFAILVVIVALVVSVSGFFYWQYLKTTPQYSLALLIDAARNNEDQKVNEIVDTDAVIDDFVPQVIDKAVELYGRGLPKSLISRVAKVAAPALGVVKERARSELPRQLREKTKSFDNIPFFAIVVGADRYLDIKIDGDKALVKSKLKDRPLELTMNNDDGRWKIVAVKDEALAEKIAKRVGQQLVALVQQRSKEGVDNLGDKFGVKNLGDLIKKAEKLIKRP